MSHPSVCPSCLFIFLPFASSVLLLGSEASPIGETTSDGLQSRGRRRGRNYPVGFLGRGQGARDLWQSLVVVQYRSLFVEPVQREAPNKPSLRPLPCAEIT